MNKSNVADFKVAAQKRNLGKLVNVVEARGSEVSHYKANVKSELMLFVYEQVKEMKQKEAAKALDITQAQVSLLKNLRVSQFSIDRLFEMAFRAGFTIDMAPYRFAQVGYSANEEQREVE